MFCQGNRASHFANSRSVGHNIRDIFISLFPLQEGANERAKAAKCLQEHRDQNTEEGIENEFVLFLVTSIQVPIYFNTNSTAMFR